MAQCLNNRSKVWFVNNQIICENLSSLQDLSIPNKVCPILPDSFCFRLYKMLDDWLIMLIYAKLGPSICIVYFRSFFWVQV